MSQSAPAGVYVLQPQTLTPGTQNTGPGGPQPVQIVPPTGEAHYGATSISDGTSAPNTNGPLLLDGANSGTLANRVSMEFYNYGTNPVEVSTNPNFVFGKAQGRTIAPGASWTLSIGPASVNNGVKHYAICGSGLTCQLEITELGQ